MAHGGSSAEGECSGVTAACNAVVGATSEGLMKLHDQLLLSIVATPIEMVMAPGEYVFQIYQAIIAKYGRGFIPSKVVGFAPDFMLIFKSEAIRDAVLECGVLSNDCITASLRKWEPDYRSSDIYWDCKVEITVTRIPPQACHRDILSPLLAGHCDILSYKCNSLKGEAQVMAFAAGVSAIPTSGNVSFPVRMPSGTLLKSFPVNISCRLCPDGSRNSSQLLHGDIPTSRARVARDNFSKTVADDGVDPDVLAELYEGLKEEEEKFVPSKRARPGPKSPDSSSEYEGYGGTKDYDTGSDDLSDREPADWKGKDE